MNDEHTPVHEHEKVGMGLQYVVRMLRFLFFGLRILIVISLVFVLFGGVFYVREHEEAMIFRFGELIEKDGKEVLTSGEFYWAWPYPVDRVRRIPAQRSMTITTTQHWPLENPNQLQEQQAGPASEQGLRPGESGYVLTGDANIMHMIWTVTYVVDDAKRYYLSFYDDAEQGGQDGAERGAEAIIESALAQAALAEVARWPVEDVLVRYRQGEDEDAERESLANAVWRRVGAQLDEFDLGIDIQQVSLVEVQPPVATANAFRESLDAAQEQSTEINKAKQYEKRVIAEAEGRSSEILASAEAYKTRTVEEVKAERGYFLKVLEEYDRNPETMLVALYTDAVRDVLSKVGTKYVVHSRENGSQEIRLLLGPKPKKRGEDTEQQEQSE
mgnify:CR=1 FL=1